MRCMILAIAFRLVLPFTFIKNHLRKEMPIFLMAINDSRYWVHLLIPLFLSSDLFLSLPKPFNGLAVRKMLTQRECSCWPFSVLPPMALPCCDSAKAALLMNG